MRPGATVPLFISLLILTLPTELGAGPIPLPGVELVQDDALVTEIRQLLRKGEYDDAEEALGEARADSSAILCLRAQLLHETGRGAAALELVVGAPAYANGDVELMLWAAALHIETGAAEVAERELDRAIAELDKSDAAGTAAADAASLQNRRRTALRIEALTQLGLLAISRGARARGAEHLNKVVDYYKKLSNADAAQVDPETYIWMGRALEGLNRYSEAYQVMYSSAFDLDAEHPRAHLCGGEIMLTKYNYPDARSHFKDALKTNKNLAAAHIGFAAATYVDFQFPGDRFQVVVDALKAADRVWKNHPRALMLRSQLAFDSEDWPAAEAHIRAALAQNPRSLANRGYLAAVLYCTYRLAEFKQLCEETEALHPAAAEFYTILAEQLVKRFFYSEATNYAEQAIKLDPEYVPAFVIFGVNCLRVGRENEGKIWVAKAFAADKFNIWAKNTQTLIGVIEKGFIETTTPDFVFRMPKDEERFILPYLQPLLEEAKQRYEAEYNFKPSGPIVIEGFSKHDHFSARSIGLPGLAAAGVCFGKMVTLTTPRALPVPWGAVALHEYAHVITVQKTGHRIPRWFTEGLSTFEEGRHIKRWTNYDQAEDFVEAVHNDLLLPMSRLQSGFTRPDSPGRVGLSYFQGGTICTYITERYGFGKIVEMLDAYRNGKTTEQIFPELLGLSLDEFDRDYLVFARRLADSFGFWPRIVPSRIPALRDAVEDNPQDIDSLVALATAYFYSDQITDAELAIGRALKVKSDHADLQQLVGLLRLKQGKTKTAAESFSKAIELGTRDRYRARLGLAMILAQDGERARAIELLREAIKICPIGIQPRLGANRNPYYLLVELLNKEGREDEGIAVLEEMLAVSRQDLAVRQYLGEHYASQENWSKVVEAMWDAVFINPYEVKVHNLLAKAYAETQDYRKALRELRFLAEDEGTAKDEVYSEIAWCHLQLREFLEARKWAERTIELAPDNARAKEVLEKLPE
ncbi:MAG: tetratricopeptide repeat protein [Planctomycetota bacterium]